jgi:hypothetical protein
MEFDDDDITVCLICGKKDPCRCKEDEATLQESQQPRRHTSIKVHCKNIPSLKSSSLVSSRNKVNSSQSTNSDD